MTPEERYTLRQTMRAYSRARDVQRAVLFVAGLAVLGCFIGVLAVVAVIRTGLSA